MNASLAAILHRLNDPHHLCASQGFAEALARLLFAVEHRLSLAVLVGGSGAGRTTLLRRFRRDSAVSSACIVGLHLAALSEPELRATFAEQLGIAAKGTWLRIAERLEELAHDQVPLIVLGDDADRVPLESLDFLSRLWDADATGQLRITMVMATDELSLATWPEPWLQRVDLRVELQRWSLEDATKFLDSVVGDERKRQRGFEPAAIERLYQLSHGLPRLVRRFAYLSLLATEGQQRTMVDEATVMGACHELCGVGVSLHGDGGAIEFMDDFLIT